MNYFRDVSALHDVLGVLYEKAPSEAMRAELSRLLEEWGFTPDQASLYASTVLCRNNGAVFFNPRTQDRREAFNVAFGLRRIGYAISSIYS